MVIHFLKGDCLTALKANIAGNLRHYSEPTNDWVYEFFDGENPFQEYKFQIDDFQFDTEIGVDYDLSKQDVENIIRVYSAMKNLTDTQATDERLWAGLAHGDFWNYIYTRWSSQQEKGNSETLVAAHYFFSPHNGIRRSLFVHPISRLWWAGRLTYDEKRKDPFELTRYLENGFSTMNLVMFSSNYIGNRSVARGLIEAMIELEEENYSGEKSPKDALVQATRYLNIFGGTHILDYYSEEEIKNKVLNYMHSLK